MYAEKSYARSSIRTKIRRSQLHTLCGKQAVPQTPGRSLGLPRGFYDVQRPNNTSVTCLDKLVNQTINHP